MALVALGLLTLQAAATPQDFRIPVARLADGRLVQVEPPVEIGAERFHTPWGTFQSPGNPIGSLDEGTADLKAIRLLRDFDPAEYLRRASSHGFLEEVLEVARLRGEPARAFDDLQVHRLLEEWGEHFDPVPAKIKDPQDRLEWMWDRMMKSEPGAAALIVGRMVAEVDRRSLRQDLRLGLSDLRKGLRSRIPAHRRASALLSGRQHEEQIWRPLLKSALSDDHPAVRIASAEALLAMNQEEALNGFSAALWRARSEDERIMAASLLGSYGDALTIDVLMVPLQAAAGGGGSSPSASSYFGRSVSVVSEFDVEVAQAAAIAKPRVNVVQEGVALTVRVVSTQVVRTIMHSLRQLTGANPGPRPEDWLRWYEER